MLGEKAQLHTLEGVAAASLLLLVIAYILDATSMTPLTSSTSNVHMESELKMLGQDILSAMDYAEPGYNSRLKSDILNWSGHEYIWSGAEYVEKGATDTSDPDYKLNNNLTSILSKVLTGKAIAHNVEVTYITISNNVTFPLTVNMITNGNPSNSAIKVSRKFVLHNDEINTTKFRNSPITDIDTSTNLYNIVDVKIVLWRM